jgi:hypothetical protein
MLEDPLRRKKLKLEDARVRKLKRKNKKQEQVEK